MKAERCHVKGLCGVMNGDEKEKEMRGRNMGGGYRN